MLSLIEKTIHEGIRKHYVEVMEKKEHAGASMEAGRAYVQTDVPYVHFLERLYNDAIMPIEHGAGNVGEDKHGHSHRATVEKHAH